MVMVMVVFHRLISLTFVFVHMIVRELMFHALFGVLYIEFTSS